MKKDESWLAMSYYYILRDTITMLYAQTPASRFL